MPSSNKLSENFDRHSAARHAAPSLPHAFMIQIRVIYALLIREMHTRYGRENIGFLWIVGEPILFCAGVAIVWTAIRPSHEHGVQMTAMVISGYVPLTMWRHTLSRSIKAYEVNSSLLFHRLVTPLDIILARLVLEAAGTILAGSLVLGGALFLDYVSLPNDWFLVYLGMGFCTFFSFGFAIIVAALTERSDLLEKAMAIFSYLALPLSGAFTMTDWLSPRYRCVLEYSPLANSIEMIRSGFFGIKVVPHYSIPFLLFSCTLLFIVGVSLTLRVRPYISL